MTPEVRRARLGDVPVLQALFRALDAHHAQLLPEHIRAAEETRPAGLLSAAILSEDSACFVADAGDEIVGFLWVKVDATPTLPVFVPKRFAHVEDMFVLESQRRCGVGRALLGAARSWAEERGLESVRLNVWSANEGAVRFYERHGFAPLMQRMELRL